MPITRQHEGGSEAVLPRFLQIEPVGQCNLRCPMCSLRFRKDGPPHGPPAFMQMKVFQQLIDQFHGAGQLHLQGLGEPLMHPRFFEMVSYAVGRGLLVTTNSNMTLLNEERAEECVRSGLSWIRISIDGATAATYEAIRIGSRFAAVVKNIELLRIAKQRLQASSPRLFLVMVVMKKNVHEVEEIVRLAHRFSMDQVFVQHLCHDFAEENLPVQYRSMRDFARAESLQGEDPGRIEAYFRKARATAEELNIELRLPRIDPREYPSGKPARERCDWPWSSAYISYDGRAMPCCAIGTPDRMNFGNMVQEGVRRIWNCEGYKAFRSQLESGTPPSICRSCSIYRGIF